MSTAFDWFPAPAHVTTSTTPANVTITPVVNGALLSGASLSLRNLSGGDITAVSVSVSVDGTTYGPTRSVTAGLPLAAGAALAIEVSDTEAASYRLTVTAASAGKADVVFLDEPAVRRPVTALRIAGTDAGGTSLPTATGAGEVPVSTGAGTTYTATSAGAVVATGLSAALSEEVVGTAVIADGDGGVSFTSADVSAFLASANAAAARTAIGAASAALPFGTLASRPASPAAGDAYEVTSGVATGDRYACLVAGAWTLVDYSRVRLDETPYHWWRLGDFSGGAVDSGSGSADLAAVGSGGWAYASSTPLGACAEVSGSAGSRYLRSAVGAGVALTTMATIAAWVRATGVSGTRSIFALETNQGTNSQPYATLALAITGGALRGWLTTTAQSGSGQSTTGGTIASGERHLVGATWDSGTLKLWVDGVSVATLAATGTTLYTAGSSERWTAGELVGPGERWAGSLEDLRVYTDVKDSAWWLETYARGAGTYGGQ